MTVTLDLPPRTEQAYRAEASSRGVPLEVIVREVLLAHEPSREEERLTAAEMSPEEWVRQFRVWTRSHAGDELPVLSDEAISRESIYDDRGL